HEVRCFNLRQQFLRRMDRFVDDTLPLALRYPFSQQISELMSRGYVGEVADQQSYIISLSQQVLSKRRESLQITRMNVAVLRRLAIPSGIDHHSEADYSSGVFSDFVTSYCTLRKAER